MLENEKYPGGALLQKNYTIDFLNKKRGKNNCTLPQYYIEDDHEAIIPKDIFMRVQEEMARRSSERDLKRFCRTVALFLRVDDFSFLRHKMRRVSSVSTLH